MHTLDVAFEVVGSGEAYEMSVATKNFAHVRLDVLENVFPVPRSVLFVFLE